MLKVMTIVGTRPEVIRLSRVIALLDSTVQHILVHTGQNHDFGLNGIFFRDLGIRAPDYHLRVNTSSLGTVLGQTLIRSEEILTTEKPDAVIVLGDTNSCIAAVMAKRMRVPVYHMEAGNRCFDENVPEETNRRLVDHVADFNLAYTEHARRNLLAEGIHPRRISLIGSPMREVLNSYLPQIRASDVLTRFSLTEGGYFLVSAHREENVDNPKRLAMLLDCLIAVKQEWEMPVWVSTHPRTRSRLEALTGWSAPQGISFNDPIGYHDYNRLQLSAACVLSDSGTISEESTLLHFPAITLRESIERPEALDAGSIIMTGLDKEDVICAVRLVMQAHRAGNKTVIPAEYMIANTAERTVRFILSTARRHKSWSALR